jgi:hypothetical protein
MFTVAIDRDHQLWNSHTALARDLFQTVPELVFKADAGLVACNDNRALRNRRLHGFSPAQNRDRRRALRVLAGAPEGMTEAVMLAHGFRVGLLVDLCMSKCAIATVERMIAGRRIVEVVRMKITDAGRQVLKGKGAQ